MPKARLRLRSQEPGSPCEGRSRKKRAAFRRPFTIGARACSALGELLAPSRLVQADLFALDFTSVAGHEASLGQRWLQLSVIVHQRPRNPMPDGACLSGFASAA